MALKDLLHTGKAFQCVNVLSVVSEQLATVFQQLDPTMAWAGNEVARVDLFGKRTGCQRYPGYLSASSPDTH
jgi:hypothetical protein